MHATIRLASLALLAIAAALPWRHASAETVQTCTGFIDSLPATIATQGTWCLRKDLSTAMTSGAAITIAANNVTIDCNDFKLGGLAAGDGTLATGILASLRLNATVRRCNVRGFHYGTKLSGSGHAVLDSRFDNNTFVAIHIGGDGSMVRGNRISDTGGSTVDGRASAFGILFETSYAGTVRDNFIQGVYATAGTNGMAYGALVYLLRGEVSGNTIAGLEGAGPGEVRGIANNLSPSHAVIRDNTIGAGGWDPVTGTGVACSGAIVRDNTISGITAGHSGCVDGGGNFAN